MFVQSATLMERRRLADITPTRKAPLEHRFLLSDAPLPLHFGFQAASIPHPNNRQPENPFTRHSPAQHVKQTQTHLTTPPKSSLIAPSRGNRHPNETETT